MVGAYARGLRTLREDRGADRLCERRGGEVMCVEDLPEVQQRLGLGRDPAVPESERERDAGSHIAGGETDRNVDQVIGRYGRHHGAVARAGELERSPIVSTADEDRDTFLLCQPDARRIDTPLHGDHSDAAFTQRLREAKANLSEADE